MTTNEPYFILKEVRSGVSGSYWLGYKVIGNVNIKAEIFKEEEPTFEQLEILN
jgi:hypothetical protein